MAAMCPIVTSRWMGRVVWGSTRLLTVTPASLRCPSCNWSLPHCLTRLKQTYPNWVLPLTLLLPENRAAARRGPRLGLAQSRCGGVHNGAQSVARRGRRLGLVQSHNRAQSVQTRQRWSSTPMLGTNETAIGRCPAWKGVWLCLMRTL
eukprot:366436-Chlamydomonas_euryale.AAC.35